MSKFNTQTQLLPTPAWLPAWVGHSVASVCVFFSLSYQHQTELSHPISHPHTIPAIDLQLTLRSTYAKRQTHKYDIL